MVIVAGKEGAHVAFEVDGERVNLDEIPKGVFNKLQNIIDLAPPIYF